MIYVTHFTDTVSDEVLQATLEFIDNTNSVPVRLGGVMTENYNRANPHSAQQLLTSKQLDGFTLSLDEMGCIRGFAGFYSIPDLGVTIGGVRLLNVVDNVYDPPLLLESQQQIVPFPFVMTINESNKRLWDVIKRLRLMYDPIKEQTLRQRACKFYATCTFYETPIRFNAVTQYVLSSAPINIESLDGFCR